MAERVLNFKLPTRPHRAEWLLSEDEKMMYDLSIFFDMTEGEIFNLVKSRGKYTKQVAQSYANQVFNNINAKTYIELRKAQLEALWFGTVNGEEQQTSLDERVERAFSSIKESLINKAQNANDENWMEIVKLFMKEFKKDEETKIELPRRYLAESCQTCKYKVFIDNKCDIPCNQCQYYQYAKDKGCPELKEKEQFLQK